MNERINQDIENIKEFNNTNLNFESLENQLLYIYYNINQQKDENDQQQLTLHFFNTLFEFSERVNNNNNNDRNDEDQQLKFAIQLLNQYFKSLSKTFISNNEISDQSLMDQDNSKLIIYQWLIKGLKKRFENNTRSITTDTNLVSDYISIYLKCFELTCNLIYNIPDSLKNIKEQEIYNPKEIPILLKKSKYFKDKIEILIHILNNLIQCNNNETNDSIDYSRNYIFKIYLISLQYKYLNSNNSSSNNDNSFNNDWTNQTIEQESKSLFKTFIGLSIFKKKYISCEWDFIIWQKNSIESLFRPIVNDDKWKYKNSMLVYLFHSWITSVETNHLYDIIISNTSDFGSLSKSILLVLLDCTEQDIVFHCLDIIDYLVANVKDQHLKSLFNHNNNSSTNQLYLKIYQLLKRDNEGSYNQAIGILYHIFSILYPIDQFVSPQPFIISPNNSKLSIEKAVEKQQIENSDNIFLKYKDMIQLLIQVLNYQPSSQDGNGNSHLILIRKLLILNNSIPLLTRFGIYSIQYFKVLLPTLVTIITKQKDERKLIKSTLDLLLVLTKSCWIRIYHYKDSILIPLSFLYNYYSGSEGTTFNDLILSIYYSFIDISLQLELPWENSHFNNNRELVLNLVNYFNSKNKKQDL
ncbi:hypothetical protein CYY_001501 [Polysphondylium violaceum]|uniref:Uncharacterized protein n=1 Tax=Polysphondylium violaceum TaxID=133409 RepID=A0A8J4Q0Y1_9MYCE|nr:hypothetical protein CYY_001501 [Polysphondylium violaceum]